jgi:predicted AAA+ superfamily ATPase
VDFVITAGTRRIPIEVKYTRDEASASDLRGALDFCNNSNFEAPFGLVVMQKTHRLIEQRLLAIPAAALLMLR